MKHIFGKFEAEDVFWVLFQGHRPKRFLRIDFWKKSLIFFSWNSNLEKSSEIVKNTTYIQKNMVFVLITSYQWIWLSNWLINHIIRLLWRNCSSLDAFQGDYSDFKIFWAPKSHQLTPKKHVIFTYFGLSKLLFVKNDQNDIFMP